ncbi:disulfide bond formation protein B [Francisella philomiragia]|uniref:Disulfide bond formation DsbB family protein n=1 Tax=Francisella philomiragia TaxID=28110 RepID=A0A0B6D559_9GAMM|nr:disulfide bond formation protein B [Francisella philomiragia]AJI54006.1 disulfide bond formation DsbB family protein [Francisella philomiragia]
MKKYFKDDLIKFLSAIELTGITITIISAFYFQFIMGEIPCPLCLLQRLGLLAIGFGFLLNMRYNVRPSHYALSLLAAVLTSFISLRQIALHVSDPVGFGSTVFGLHMYTWVFVISMVAIVYIAIVMSYPDQYKINKDPNEIKEAKNNKVRALTHIVFVIFLIAIFTNVTSTFIECGVHECPDDPTSYLLLTK